ncbi:MAG: efflux RND transporter periplasmic adaptor subunit [Verrucomicrobia bacterium]|nr:efflux RND transporter periplasmic adaptor subunit [Verrucomicrobiota bacterium]
MRTRIGLIVLALALASLSAGCKEKHTAQPQKLVVRVAPAAPLGESQRDTSPSYIALVRADNEPDLSFKVGGILELIGASADKDWDEGTPVKKDALLARLVQTDFVNAAKAARAHADLCRKDLGRFKQLLAERTISQQQYDMAVSNQQTADAQLGQAEQALKDSALRAPFDGVILARFYRNGETASPGKPVLRVGDLGVMSVELGVPDTVVSRIRVGQAIPVTIAALEAEPIVGRVSEVGVAAKEGTRLFKVTIKIPNPDGRIKSGMTASVPFDTGRRVEPGSVLAPLSALSTSGSRLIVFVVAGGAARERAVKTDDIVGNSIIITEGLKAGESVVVAGAANLYDGAPVEARPVDE